MSNCIISKRSSHNGYTRLRVGTRILREARFLVSKVLNLDYDDSSWEVMHMCNIRACINIEHLRVGTREENSAHRVASATHCANGHKYDRLNTKLYKGYRICKKCRNINKKKYTQKGQQVK